MYVVLAALALWSSAATMPAAGQPAGKIRRVGYLAGSASSSGTQRMREALPRGLRELGWVEGQNVAFEFRFAEGRYDRLRDLAAELVQLKVDAIVAVGNAAATAAKNTTCAIPIVNLRTARSLGLTIPKAVLLRADQIIE